MVIERTKDEVIIRLPANVNTEGLQRFINLLAYKEATANSKATQADADKLAKEVKKGWRAKNGSNIAPSKAMRLMKIKELTKTSKVDLSGFKFDRDRAND
ncbi:MAG: hypothetical protein NVSMB24_08940 [Mucilaginibacter sp.]